MVVGAASERLYIIFSDCSRDSIHEIRRRFVKSAANPCGICVDPCGGTVVVDAGNNRLQVMNF